MDLEKKDIVDFSYKKLRASLMYLSIYQANRADDIWRERAKLLTECLYAFYDYLPKNDKTGDISEYINLDTVSSYSLTGCFPKLRNYLLTLPGYSENNIKQNNSAYENYGYLIMQITETMASLEYFYTDENLKPFVIEKIGVKSFIEIYKKKHNLEDKVIKNLYFKNGVINIFGSIGIMTEDNVLTNYYIDDREIEKKKTYKFDFRLFEEGKDVLPEERKRKLFNLLFKELTREQIIDIAKDNFDLLDVTDNIEEIKELIELNYAY